MAIPPGSGGRGLSVSRADDANGERYDKRIEGRAQPVFFGTHKAKIDAKKRASVPAAFRNHVLGGAPDFKGVAVFPSLKPEDPAYMACSPEYLTTLDDRIREADLDPDEADAIASAIFPYVEMLAFDDGGRIGLSQMLRDHLGASAEVVFVGKGRQLFEIWEPETFKAHAEPQRAAMGPSALSILFDRRPRTGPGSNGAGS